MLHFQLKLETDFLKINLTCLHFHDSVASASAQYVPKFSVTIG